jgi:hypothetical protein
MNNTILLLSYCIQKILVQISSGGILYRNAADYIPEIRKDINGLIKKKVIRKSLRKRTQYDARLMQISMDRASITDEY